VLDPNTGGTSWPSRATPRCPSLRSPSGGRRSLLTRGIIHSVSYVAQSSVARLSHELIMCLCM
jgi:hypothetical protein